MQIDIEKIRREKPIQQLLQFSLVNINKPSGPTSFKVSQSVRRALGLKKGAHMGTLDPMVTGVLPVTLGRACRLAEYFMHRDKIYIGLMRLHGDIGEDELRDEMKKFLGTITQIPPKRSAVKRAPRQRLVRRFELLEKYKRHAQFIAEVEAGTYIRMLVHELGENACGAHMLKLHRTKAGMFDESTMWDYDEFQKRVDRYQQGDEDAIREVLIPAEIVSALMPVAQIKDETVRKAYFGQPLRKEDYMEFPDLEEETRFCLFHGNTFIAVQRKVTQDDIVGKYDFVLT